MIILNEDHLRRVLREFIAFYNSRRPHQGIGQKIPGESAEKNSSERPPASSSSGPVRAVPILNGLHHHYYRESA